MLHIACFDLRIPVAPGRIANLHQTSVVDRTVVTLERAATTPTGTRVSLRGVGSNADVQLVVDGVIYPLHCPDGMAIPYRWDVESRWEYISGTSLQDNYMVNLGHSTSLFHNGEIRMLWVPVHRWGKAG